MNTLFVLGNGFDICLGMNTRYQDFYKFYLKQDSSNSLVKKLKESISQDSSNWSDFENAFGDYTKNLSTVDEFDIIFDNIIESLRSFLQSEEAGIILVPTEDEFKQRINNPEDYCTPQIKSIINEFSAKWANSIRYSSVVTFNYTNLIDRLLNIDLKPTIIGQKNNNPIYLTKLIHIHGYIDKSMTLGVNDNSQIGNKIFRENLDIVESLVKITSNALRGHNLDDEFRGEIDRANLIFIYGCSLGKTDKYWWNLILKRLEEDCRLIIFHYTPQVSDLKDYRIGRVNRDVEKILKSYTNDKTDAYEKIKEKIFISINSDIFDFKVPF